MNWLHKATIYLTLLAVGSFFFGAIGPGLGFMVLALCFGILAPLAA
jgi:hypothetical protein